MSKWLVRLVIKEVCCHIVTRTAETIASIAGLIAAITVIVAAYTATGVNPLLTTIAALILYALTPPPEEQGEPSGSGLLAGLRATLYAAAVYMGIGLAIAVLWRPAVAVAVAAAALAAGELVRTAVLILIARVCGPGGLLDDWEYV